jgi:hypothetical protein
VIDRFENGVATSIKSLDLGAVSYQDASALTSRVQGYVNSLANWQGVASWDGVSIFSNDITARELLLAIPSGGTPSQMAALQQIQTWAAELGASLNINVVP